MTKRRLINIKEAAEMIGIKPSTLYSWANQRRISFVKLGRRVLFDVNDLEDCIEKNKVRQKEF